MKIRKRETYLLHWRKNSTTWNEDLKELKRTRNLIRINKQYYTVVFAHYDGDFDVVDCTCDDKGNFYPINTSLLKEI